MYSSLMTEIAAQRVEDRVESIPYDATAAFDPGVRKHLPQNIRNFSRHRIPLFVADVLALSVV